VAEPKAEAKPAAEAEAKPTAEAEPEPEAKAKPKAGAKAEPEPEAESEEPDPETTKPPAQPQPAPRRRSPRPDTAPAFVRARAKYVRTSARKARLVSDHIRGKSVDEARAILAFAPRAAARDWSKLLESAVANAEHNHELIGDDLRIKDIYADEGPTLKRYRPRAMGRATRIRKRTSHLTITLTPKEDA
jgi:ribosomal protein L22